MEDGGGERERMTLVARKPCFSLPTACPSCLPVYIYLKFCKIPFSLEFNLIHPDSGTFLFSQNVCFVFFKSRCCFASENIEQVVKSFWCFNVVLFFFLLWFWMICNNALNLNILWMRPAPQIYFLLFSLEVRQLNIYNWYIFGNEELYRKLAVISAFSHGYFFILQICGLCCCTLKFQF